MTAAAAALRWVKTSSSWTYRTLVWLTLTILLLCAGIVLGLRYWVLPNIDDFREDIARIVSSASRQHIAIGRISGNWDGLRPRLVLENVTVYDRAERPALELGRVDTTLSWRTLATMRLTLYALDIHRPVLDVRRDADGVIRVAGIALESEGGAGGFADWVLRQPDIEVHDATVQWTDEWRGAPPLALEQVNARLVNRGRRHRFGLRAEAPREIARGIDVRGDLRGRTSEALSEWTGRLYVQLDHVDIAAWRAWVPFPIEFPRGTGALRAWLTFDEEHELAHAIADVDLADVRTRLRKDLPELELDRLSGRFAWKTTAHRHEITTTGLSLRVARLGLALPPADALLRLHTDGSGGVTAGELQANVLDLAPLAMLADRLPIADDLRGTIAALEPRGLVRDVALRWKGEWPAPRSYSARLHFSDIGFKRWQRLPGVAGMSGSLEATEKGGTLTTDATHASLDLPSVFREAIRFDTVNGQVAWSVAKDGLHIRFQDVAVANADLAGTAAGSYHRRTSGSDLMDFSGALTRADARATPRYLPVSLVGESMPWFDRAFLAGHSRDVRFRVKGSVADFPYPGDRRGIFSVVAKVAGGALNYDEDWPRIDDIEGELQFRGQRMDILARQGRIYGVRLGKVQASIPDLTADAPVLSVAGEAEGATPDFLAFIAKSPVNAMIDGFTGEARAQGRGRLALKLVLPLENLAGTQVSGAYTFVNNHLVIDGTIPPIDQVNGRLEFTDRGVRIAGATGVFLGGPVTVSATTQREGAVRIGMTGRINADSVRRLGGGLPVMEHLRGATDWRGSFILHRKTADLVIESTLQGMAADLPAPFAKRAADMVALRIERRQGGEHEHFGFTYGNVASGQFVLRREGDRTVVDRGVVRLGGGAAGEPDRPGVWVSGTVPLLDFDDWLRFAGEGDAGASYRVNGMDVTVAHMDVFGRRFNDLAVTATASGGAVQIAATAREFEGSGTWQPQGRGRLTARLKHLAVPPAETRLTELREAGARSAKPPDLPALDLVVENFQVGQKQLGRLEVNAVHESRDWRIERLRLSNPDSTLSAEGVWQAWLSQPRTQVNVRFDVSDIGRTLARWGYPEGVRRGTAKIEGTLSWAGSPQEFDYPTLAGNLVIDAARGQFVKLDPGIAKLLGILSLQALPRRITLDFRDVFSEGFAFDAILGAVTISRGVASTDNLRIVGPSAQVVMRGVVDLARETQSLRVRVNPHISDSVSIAGALIGGPVAGVAAFLAQKLLKDPLDQIIGFDYAITGNWSDPQVTKLERAERESRDSPP